VQVAQQVAQTAPAKQPAPITVKKATPVAAAKAAPQPAAPPPPAASPAPAATTAAAVASAEPPPGDADLPSGAIPDPADTTAAAPPAPRCDVSACETAYRSFRVSDCTWQPFDGPRRFCDKGTPPKTNHSAAEIASAAQARAPSCNVQACARAYQSFDAGDCTYQPYQGPRQFCQK
jgi:hypothetical protein